MNQIRKHCRFRAELTICRTEGHGKRTQCQPSLVRSLPAIDHTQFERRP
jgi:hypothetical protein